MYQEQILTSDWAIVTAENPNAVQLRPRSNQALNNAAVELLKEWGYEPIPMKGKYGNEENSFFVLGMTRADVLSFIREFSQEAAACSFGMLYKDGSFAKRTGTSFNSDADDFYSVIGDLKFQISYDF